MRLDCHNCRSSVFTQVPKRRGVGGMALYEDGGLIMGGRDLVVSNIDGTDMRPLFLGADSPAGIGFNDMSTDTAGRIYVGSLGFRISAGEEPKTGFLHMIDLDGSVKPRLTV
ncbi:SMP-30/gluconolactonase/LRE family protein [Thermodesulfobacteriota bacterium]